MENGTRHTVNGISFLSPYFLFGLAAIALPILYHFVRKVKAKKVQFSSLMFLTATPKELIKRRRLRDLVLMAMRAAIFGLLALMFARPFLSQDKLPFFSKADAESVVILLDKSYSLQHRGAFDKTKEEALKQIAELGEDDEASIVVFSDEAEQVTALTQDISILTGFVNNNLSTDYRTTDFYQALRLASDILNDAKHDDRKIVMISDFQASAWSGALENWKLDSKINFLPISVAEEVLNNASIQDLAVSQKRRGEEVAISYDSRIQPSSNTSADLKIDDSSLGSKSVIEGATRRISYQQISPRTGVFQGALSLNTDDLEADNNFFFTYDVSDRPSILVVDDRHRQSLSDAFFLRKVFGLGENALYDFESISAGQMDRRTLRNHSIVFLTNLPSLSAGQTSVLMDYIERGGKLVISFGPSTQASRLSDQINALGLGTIENVVSARSLQSREAIVGNLDLRHPIFSLFADASGGAILKPQFRRYAKVIASEEARVLASYDSGDPFLIERELGKGRILMNTSSFNTAWTDFPVQESYVPFLYQLVGYTQEASDRSTQFKVGEVVTLTGDSGASWELRNPEGNIFKIDADSSGLAYFKATELPGHYVAAQSSESYAFSVNVDPKESDLIARDQEEVYAAVVPPRTEFEGTPEQLASLTLQEQEKDQKLWRILLMLALVLFVLETFLSNRVFVKKRSTGKINV